MFCNQKCGMGNCMNNDFSKTCKTTCEVNQSFMSPHQQHCPMMMKKQCPMMMQQNPMMTASCPMKMQHWSMMD